jgi:16S rRNA (guanine527-N7)-methyltransferase
VRDSLRLRVTRRIERFLPALRPEAREQLVAYFDLLAKWNQRMNLTARVESDDSIDRLLIEPVIASRFLPRGEFRLLDVGSGGGSPAIPMKLMAPAMRLWMVEPKTRKSAFLREAVRQLGLSATVVEPQRVEDLLSSQELDDSMDVVSIRAVRVDPKLLQRVALLLKRGGELFLFVAASSRLPATLDPSLPVRGRERLVDALQSELLRIGRQ